MLPQPLQRTHSLTHAATFNPPPPTHTLCVTLGPTTLSPYSGTKAFRNAEDDATGGGTTMQGIPQPPSLEAHPGFVRAGSAEARMGAKLPAAAAAAALPAARRAARAARRSVAGIRAAGGAIPRHAPRRRTGGKRGRGGGHRRWRWRWRARRRQPRQTARGGAGRARCSANSAAWLASARAPRRAVPATRARAESYDDQQDIAWRGAYGHEDEDEDRSSASSMTMTSILRRSRVGATRWPQYDTPAQAGVDTASYVAPHDTGTSAPPGVGCQCRPQRCQCSSSKQAQPPPPHVNPTGYACARGHERQRNLASAAAAVAAGAAAAVPGAAAVPAPSTLPAAAPSAVHAVPAAAAAAAAAAAYRARIRCLSSTLRRYL